TACGRGPAANHYATVTRKASLKERVEAWLSHAVATCTPAFAATHMAWGALNEMTSSLAYTQIARTTRNRELQKLVTRMAKDERRHQAFYYHQAERRLAASGAARAICRFALKRFWDPVGMGVGDNDSFGFFVAYLFDSEEGLNEFKRIDENMSKLPGLEGFDLVQQRIPAAGAAYKRAHPEAARAPEPELEQPLLRLAS